MLVTKCSDFNVFTQNMINFGFQGKM